MEPKFEATLKLKKPDIRVYREQSTQRATEPSIQEAELQAGHCPQTAAQGLRTGQIPAITYQANTRCASLFHAQHKFTFMFREFCMRAEIRSNNSTTLMKSRDTHF